MSKSLKRTFSNSKSSVQSTSTRAPTYQNIGYLDNRVSFEIEDDKTKSFFADIDYKVSTFPCLF